MQTSFIRQHPDLIALLGILVVLNLHLLGLPVDHRLFVAAPSAIQAGRWWTAFTHGFVHVSLYHLLLDAGAVLLIYPILSSRATRRLAALAVCIAGSGLGAMWMPDIDAYGFCGLSGAGHGLMAILALQLAHTHDPMQRRAGRVLALVLLLKSLVEALSGQVLFAGMHMGSVGNPNTLSHLAGTLTGLIYGNSMQKGVLAHSLDSFFKKRSCAIGASG